MEYSIDKTVILPADKLNHGKYLVFNKENKLCVWDTHTMGTQRTLSAQCLYILSDEKIKEGDWVYDVKTEEIGCIVSIREQYEYCFVFANQQTHKHHLIDCKKIIATNDPDLLQDIMLAPPCEENAWLGEYEESPVKPLSEEFISDYCLHFNKTKTTIKDRYRYLDIIIAIGLIAIVWIGNLQLGFFLSNLFKGEYELLRFLILWLTSYWCLYSSKRIWDGFTK